MGQYQQWLRYREFKQQLQAQLQQLEQELRLLQDEADQLRATLPTADNAIIQALKGYHTLQTLLTRPVESSGAEQQATLTNTLHETPGESISPALFAWSQLPDFGTAQRQETEPAAAAEAAPTVHGEVELLPQDMMAFFDEHTQTSPQVRLPWWLRKTVNAAQEDDTPVDAQSVRTNESIQRWFERRGRLSADKVEAPQKAEVSPKASHHVEVPRKDRQP